MKSYDLGYNKGKEEAFTEVLRYVLVISKSVSFLPINDFIQYLQTRYDVLKQKGLKLTQAITFQPPPDVRLKDVHEQLQVND